MGKKKKKKRNQHVSDKGRKNEKPTHWESDDEF